METATQIKLITDYPEDMRWNLKDRSAKAVRIDGVWHVRIRWSAKLGLEHRTTFEANGKHLKRLISLINDPKSKGLLVNDPNSPWRKITGRDLDESFLQDHISW